MVEGAIEHARSSLTGFLELLRIPIIPPNSRTCPAIIKSLKIFNRSIKAKAETVIIFSYNPAAPLPIRVLPNISFNRFSIRVDQFLSGNRFPNLKIQFSGGMITRIEENRVIQNDLKNSVVVAVVLVTFILALYNRSILSIILLFIPLITSLSLTFALTRLLIGHVNIISGFLVAILTGLGINYGIHLYIRFKQELRKGQTIPAAAELVATQVGTIRRHRHGHNHQRLLFVNVFRFPGIL